MAEEPPVLSPSVQLYRRKTLLWPLSVICFWKAQWQPAIRPHCRSRKTLIQKCKCSISSPTFCSLGNKICVGSSSVFFFGLIHSSHIQSWKVSNVRNVLRLTETLWEISGPSVKVPAMLLWWFQHRPTWHYTILPAKVGDNQPCCPSRRVDRVGCNVSRVWSLAVLSSRVYELWALVLSLNEWSD